MELVIGPAQGSRHHALRAAGGKHQVGGARRTRLAALPRPAAFPKLARLINAPPLTAAVRPMRRAGCFPGPWHGPTGGLQPPGAPRAAGAARPGMRRGTARGTEGGAGPARGGGGRAGLPGKKRRGGQRRLAKRMKDVQSALGDHQDAVIIRAEARMTTACTRTWRARTRSAFGLLHERAHPPGARSLLADSRAARGEARQPGSSPAAGYRSLSSPVRRGR